MDETIIGLLVIIGLFFVIPIVIFLIIRKVLSDRHKERMAMIERGINPSYRQAEPQPERPKSPYECEKDIRGPWSEPAPEPTPEPVRRTTYRKTPKAEDSTVKWMYIFAGIAVGLLIASIVTNLLYTYTLIDTGGIGFSIVVLSACISLYIYYNRRNRRTKEYLYRQSQRYGEKTQDERPENYTED